MNIQQRFNRLGHPQGNSQVESMNKAIVKGLESKKGKYKKIRVDEIPSILWAHRTSPGRTTSETLLVLYMGHTRLSHQSLQFQAIDYLTVILKRMKRL